MSVEPLSFKQKLYKLEKLKEQRDEDENKVRFGVKPRWKTNPKTMMRNLKESLTTKGILT
jgi:hypothetical protein